MQRLSNFVAGPGKEQIDRHARNGREPETFVLSIMTIYRFPLFTFVKVVRIG